MASESVANNPVVSTSNRKLCEHRLGNGKKPAQTYSPIGNPKLGMYPSARWPVTPPLTRLRSRVRWHISGSPRLRARVLANLTKRRSVGHTMVTSSLGLLGRDRPSLAINSSTTVDGAQASAPSAHAASCSARNPHRPSADARMDSGIPRALQYLSKVSCG